MNYKETMKPTHRQIRKVGIDSDLYPYAIHTKAHCDEITPRKADIHGCLTNISYMFVDVGSP